MKTERDIAVPLHRCCALRPQWEPELEKAMLRSLEGQSRLPGKTVLLVDVSGSMDAPSLAVRKCAQ